MKKKKAFMLMDVIVSIFVISFTIVSVYKLSIATSEYFYDLSQRKEALLIARNIMEEELSKNVEDIYSISPTMYEGNKNNYYSVTAAPIGGYEELLLGGKYFSGAATDYVDYGSTNFDFSKGFKIIFDGKWDSLNKWSRVMDFGNGTSQDNVSITNNGTTNTLSFYIWKGATSYNIDIANGITQGVYARWIMDVDSTGYCKVYKDGTLVGGKQLVLPNNITRTKCYIGKSNWSTDSMFNGEIKNLSMVTYSANGDSKSAYIDNKGKKITVKVKYFRKNKGAVEVALQSYKSSRIQEN